AAAAPAIVPGACAVPGRGAAFGAFGALRAVFDPVSAAGAASGVVRAVEPVQVRSRARSRARAQAVNMAPTPPQPRRPARIRRALFSMSVTPPLTGTPTAGGRCRAPRPVRR